METQLWESSRRGLVEEDLSRAISFVRFCQVGLFS